MNVIITRVEKIGKEWFKFSCVNVDTGEAAVGWQRQGVFDETLPVTKLTDYENDVVVEFNSQGRIDTVKKL